MKSSAQDPNLIHHSAFRISHCVTLALLTLFAGAIRFYQIGRPCLWYDETMVFWRTCGTYGQLLDCLRTDGFVPLHYSLIWVITRLFRPIPLVLRFVPALCGTLMVPAVYFLACQLLNRKTSLVAAAFTAFSAFNLFYSRDAKMYMDAWLFVTLNAGCLLWWFRSRSSTAWLCWIASGAAACGLQISSLIPVALSSFFFFTQNTISWQRTLSWLAGVLLIVAGPIVHYEKFNKWIVDVQEEGWKKSQLEWINDYNRGRDGPQLVRFLGTSMGIGWEWPRADDIRAIQPERFSRPSTCAEILLVILIAGCLPWPRRWWVKISRSQTPVLRYAEEPDSLVIDPALRRTSEPASAENPQPPWRVFLWLSISIVLPVYGFYCRSMPDFAGPIDWWHWAKSQNPPLYRQFWWLESLILLLIGWRIYQRLREQPFRQDWRYYLTALLRYLSLVTIAAVVLALCWVTFSVMTAQAKAAVEAGKAWESLWVPRYLGFIWAPLAIAVAALIMRLPTGWVRVPAILFLLGVNLWVASKRILGDTEPPVDLMAYDFVQSQVASTRTMTRMDIEPGMVYPGGGNLFSAPGEYYVELMTHLSTNPPAFKKAFGLRERTWPSGFPRFGSIDIPLDIDRIIIWNQYGPDAHIDGDDLLPRFPGWQLAGDSRFMARDCWIWKDLSLYRRREYSRTPRDHE